MISASERAVQKLKDDLLRKVLDLGVAFRISMDDSESGKACIDVVLDKKGPNDEVLDFHGMKVFLDAQAARQLRDFELDYVDEPAALFLLKPKAKRARNTRRWGEGPGADK